MPEDWKKEWLAAGGSEEDLPVLELLRKRGVYILPGEYMLVLGEYEVNGHKCVRVQLDGYMYVELDEEGEGGEKSEQ